MAEEIFSVLNGLKSQSQSPLNPKYKHNQCQNFRLGDQVEDEGEHKEGGKDKDQDEDEGAGKDEDEDDAASWHSTVGKTAKLDTCSEYFHLYSLKIKRLFHKPHSCIKGF